MSLGKLDAICARLKSFQQPEGGSATELTTDGDSSVLFFSPDVPRHYSKGKSQLQLSNGSTASPRGRGDESSSDSSCKEDPPANCGQTLVKVTSSSPLQPWQAAIKDDPDNLDSSVATSASFHSPVAISNNNNTKTADFNARAVTVVSPLSLPTLSGKTSSEGCATAPLDHTVQHSPEKSFDFSHSPPSEDSSFSQPISTSNIKEIHPGNLVQPNSNLFSDVTNSIGSETTKQGETCKASESNTDAAPSSSPSSKPQALSSPQDSGSPSEPISTSGPTLLAPVEEEAKLGAHDDGIKEEGSISDAGNNLKIKLNAGYSGSTSPQRPTNGTGKDNVDDNSVVDLRSESLEVPFLEHGTEATFSLHVKNSIPEISDTTKSEGKVCAESKSSVSDFGNSNSLSADTAQEDSPNSRGLGQDVSDRHHGRDEAAEELSSSERSWSMKSNPGVAGHKIGQSIDNASEAVLADCVQSNPKASKGNALTQNTSGSLGNDRLDDLELHEKGEASYEAVALSKRFKENAISRTQVGQGLPNNKHDLNNEDHDLETLHAADNLHGCQVNRLSDSDKSAAKLDVEKSQGENTLAPPPNGCVLKSADVPTEASLSMCNKLSRVEESPEQINVSPVTLSTNPVALGGRKKSRKAARPRRQPVVSQLMTDQDISDSDGLLEEKVSKNTDRLDGSGKPETIFPRASTPVDFSPRPDIGPNSSADLRNREAAVPITTDKERSDLENKESKPGRENSGTSSGGESSAECKGLVDFAHNTMQELLGIYGLEEGDARDSGLSINRLRSCFRGDTSQVPASSTSSSTAGGGQSPAEVEHRKLTRRKEEAVGARKSRPFRKNVYTSLAHHAVDSGE
ncbi:hypothetical protein RRG08_023721 [Elysia crispata]|uniref:Uncharacterized protein n=1 Tax=Elysia crispata TaxID=231223 RepID=A0AAE1D7Q8_9GAST|nr:hypothetical protein RRG08_023721 [Elysia crispata]